jgi:hypothetical protein
MMLNLLMKESLEANATNTTFVWAEVSGHLSDGLAHSKSHAWVLV